MPSAARWRDRFEGFVLGPRFARRMALSHAVDDLGDAMVNLALVGSLFFSVSVDASRSRITWYLILAAAPLVVAAPLVGNFLDRTRFGYRAAISGSQVLRAIVALLMVGSLLSLVLFPLAFLVLISRKVYALARASLLSQMTADPNELLLADSHIARTGTIAGGVGTVIAGVLLATGHVEVMLLVAAPIFLTAAVISRSLPRPTSAIGSMGVPRLAEAIPPEIWSATIAVTALRASGGALTYLLAFAIKRGGGDQWIFAAGLMAAGVGGLLANLFATRIHHRWSQDWIVVLSLIVPGVTCLIGVGTAGNLGVIAIAFAIGLGRGIGTRSITLLNASVAPASRARSIARSELVFQVASVVGAILAVQLAPTPNAGFAVSSVVLIGSGIAFGSRQRLVLKQHAARALLGEQAPAVHDALPDALLLEAQRLASLGAYRMAIVVAGSAVDVRVEREPLLAETPEYQLWRDLVPKLIEVRASDVQPADDVVEKVLTAADGLVNMRVPRVRSRVGRRRVLV